MSDTTVEDFLEVDTPIGGQNYACLSFISPEKILKEKNLQFVHKFLKTIAKNYDLDSNTIVEKYKDFLYVNETQLQEEFNQENDFQTSVRGVKVRGVYSTLKEAQMKAKKLQNADPNFNVYLGQVGYWLPWDPRPDKIEGQEYAESELNNLVKKYRENQDNKDQHFRENIEYVKQQEAEKKKLFLEQKAEANVSEVSNLTDGLGEVDPWMRRKLDAVGDGESVVNAAN